MSPIAEFRASDLKQSGSVLDAAQRGAVRITRNRTRFVLIEETRFRQMLEDAADPRPKTLADLVSGYDAAEVRRRLAPWMADEPADAERL